jgi:transposase-like protein
MVVFRPRSFADMDNKRVPTSERLRAVAMLRESSFNYAAIAAMLNLPESTLRRWNDKYGPAVKDTIEDLQDPGVIVMDSSLDVLQSNSEFIKQASKVRKLALSRLEDLVSAETDVKKLVDAVKVMSEIMNEGSTQEKPKGSYLLQIIEKQYISKHGNKSSQPPAPGNPA